MDELVIELSQAAFDNFRRRYRSGAYGRTRLGQAFYDEFNLQALPSDTPLNEIWKKDGDHALSVIRSMTHFV